MLCTAHAETRQRMLPTREFNYSLSWCRERRLYVQPLSYRSVVAQELKKALANAKPHRDRSRSDPTDAEAHEVASLRYLAWIEPLNRAGAAAFRTAQAKADSITVAAQKRREA